MTMFYSFKKSLKAACFSVYKYGVPHTGLSRYFPNVKKIAEWLAMPPLAPADRPAKIKIKGLEFDLYLSHRDPTISPRIFANQVWEKNESLVLVRVIKPSMCVLDLGAHFGYYSVLAGKLVGKEGRVYAFEPDAANFALLQKNIAKNGLTGVVIPIQKAAGSDNEEKILYGVSLADSSDRTLFPTGQQKLETRIHSVRVEDYLNQHHHESIESIQVIKMDIEGFEPYALSGMDTMLKKEDIILLVEINYERLRQAGSSARLFLDRLTDYGFVFYEIDPAENEEKNILKKRSVETLAVETEYHKDIFCVKGTVYDAG